MEQKPEPQLNIRRMVRLFVVTIVFMKIPLIYFGTKIAEDPQPWNILAFIGCLLFSLTSLVLFVVRD